MTDDSGLPPGSRRKRPPTVLDLKATEVEASPAAADAPPAPPPEIPAEPSAEQKAAETPPHEPELERPAAEPTEPSFAPRANAGWLPEGFSWSHVGAGIAGAVGGLLVFLLLWLGGALSGVRDSSTDAGPQLAEIQKQLQDLSNRRAPASVDPKALDAIATRLARLETSESAPRQQPAADPALAARIGAAEDAAKPLGDSIKSLGDAVKPLGDNVTALSRRADGIDGAQRDANARIEKLTAALGSMQAALREAQAGSDRASRLAVAAAALRNAIERGAPFAAELAVVKTLAADAPEIVVLEPFAASGVPNDAALGQELAALVQPMLVKPAEPQAINGAGFLERLQTNAEKLVRVTPVGEARGDDRGAILARTEQRGARGDVAGAIAELNKLPADARAPFQAWIERAQARGKAVDAGRRLAEHAIAALKPSP